MSALCSGLLADLVKTVEAAKGRKELVPWLASAPTLVIGTLPEPVSPYVLLSTHSSCPQSTQTDRIDGQARVRNKSKSQSAFVSLFSKKKGPWLRSRNTPLLNAKVTIHLSALLPSRLFNVHTTHFRPEHLATTKVGKGCDQQGR